MCKVMIMPKVTAETRENALRFIDVMGKLMTTGNNDGLGYAAVDTEGKLFGERWLTNSAAFPELQTKRKDPVISSLNSVLTYADKETISTEVKQSEYTNFGDVKLNDIAAITLHTRMATSAKGIHNTHPFVDKDTSVIHNGVIHNTEDFKFTLSTCDSEAILISYLEEKVNINPQKFLNNMSGRLVGYYAAATFSRDASGRRILDIFKAHNNNLVVAWIEELDTFVFTSMQHNIKEACETLGFVVPKCRSIADGHFIRMLAGSNDITELYSFKEGDRYRYSGGGYTSTTQSVTATNTAPSKVVTLPSKKNLTPEEIDFLKQKPSFEVMSEREAADMLNNIMDRYNA